MATDKPPCRRCGAEVVDSWDHDPDGYCRQCSLVLRSGFDFTALPAVVWETHGWRAVHCYDDQEHGTYVRLETTDGWDLMGVQRWKEVDEFPASVVARMLRVPTGKIPLKDRVPEGDR